MSAAGTAQVVERIKTALGSAAFTTALGVQNALLTSKSRGFQLPTSWSPRLRAQIEEPPDDTTAHMRIVARPTLEEAAALGGVSQAEVVVDVALFLAHASLTVSDSTPYGDDEERVISAVYRAATAAKVVLTDPNIMQADADDGILVIGSVSSVHALQSFVSMDGGDDQRVIAAQCVLTLTLTQERSFGA